MELPSVNEHIRKIKIYKKNTLELQTIPFTYTLIARATKQARIYYRAQWDDKIKVWQLSIAPQH
jgi:hypothetical protein